MAAETKAEIVVVGAVAAFLLWLWSRNQAQAAPGATTSLSLPALGDNTFPVLGSPLFNIPAATSGDTLEYQGGDIVIPDITFSYRSGDTNLAGGTFSYRGGDITLPPAPDLGGLPQAPDFAFPAGQPSSCDCAGSANLSNTFGSNADLSAWLASQPSIADVIANARKWY